MLFGGSHISCTGQHTLHMSVTGGFQTPGAPKSVGVLMNETVQIDIFSDDMSPIQAIISKDEWGIGHIYPVWQEVGINPPGEIIPGIAYLLASDNPTQPGVHYVFYFVHDNFQVPESFSNVTLFDQDGATVLDSYTFYDVPEPATICLLALGGMLLRKRRS